MWIEETLNKPFDFSAVRMVTPHGESHFPFALSASVSEQSKGQELTFPFVLGANPSSSSGQALASSRRMNGKA